MKNFMILMRDPDQEMNKPGLDHKHFSQFVMDGYASEEEAMEKFRKSSEYLEHKKKHGDVEIEIMDKD